MLVSIPLARIVHWSGLPARERPSRAGRMCVADIHPEPPGRRAFGVESTRLVRSRTVTADGHGLISRAGCRRRLKTDPVSTCATPWHGDATGPRSPAGRAHHQGGTALTVSVGLLGV